MTNTDSPEVKALCGEIVRYLAEHCWVVVEADARSAVVAGGEARIRVAVDHGAVSVSDVTDGGFRFVGRVVSGPDALALIGRRFEAMAAIRAAEWAHDSSD